MRGYFIIGNMKQFTVAILILWVTIGTSEAFAPVVKTEEGSVRGIHESSLNGKDFYSFLGVPFAKPPVGDLRFKEPVAMKPWKGVLKTISQPEVCLQYSFFDLLKENKSSLVPVGKEDCLYLNVHTPLPQELDAKLPVMVFIHGGAFYSGGAQEYQPYVLLNEDIVLVVLQYRLAIFGFLSTEDSVLPGNMGLKDQQLALKWVRRNILNFGGDPDKVTIFGESAGGASVHMHMLSPGSKGLFRRAITQSGTALCPWAMDEDHRTFAKDIGNAVDCSLEEGTEAYLRCMQTADSNSLLFHGAEKLLWGISPAVMVPRVDGEFIPDRPEVLLKEGRYNNVDIMSGMTRDEGAIFNSFMCDSPHLVKTLNDDFEKTGPLSLLLEKVRQPAKIASKIFRHYYQNENIKVKSAYDEPLTRMFGDRYHTVCFDLPAVLHAGDEDISLYLYQLDHVGQHSLADFFPQCEKQSLISHGDDLLYLFSGGMFPHTLEKEEDLKMREIIVSLWTNFAKNGIPSMPNSSFVWERATLGNFRHLSLLPEPLMMDDNLRDIREFWLSLEIKQFMNLLPDERFGLSGSSEKNNDNQQKEEL